ncbi:MAG: DUF3035 domain-containing protein [Alphaproteobacteria bacterium]|nr:DUF3035 domain-containing protein [Alphaproteobacteria bacterium]
MRKTGFTALALLAAATTLAGCTWLRNSAGLTKQAPDEFAVTTKAPLVIPPGFNLMPPSPGAAPTNSLATDAQAQAAMFGAGDTTAIAANIQGNYSPAERMLLATAGVNRSDPGIRQLLQSDEGKMQGADPSFTARLMGATAQPNNGQPIDPNAEVNRRAAAPKPAAAAPKKSSGWFDWF